MLPASILSNSPTLARLASSSASRAVDLHAASAQWGARPAEERYWTLADAADAAQGVADRLSVSDVIPARVTVGVANGAPALVHAKSGNSAALSPLAFEQFARLTGAPAAYLRTLPAETAAECLRIGWERERSADPLRLQVLDAGTPSVRVRAVTSPSHDLLSNSLILRSLSELVRPGSGWKVPPARVPSGYTGATRTAAPSDVLAHAGEAGLSVRVGDTIAPSGVYCSDRDCFAILADDSPAGIVEEDGGLHRFLMVSNSETATGALAVTTGWMRGICGNHIVWGARDIIDVRAVHRGDNASRQARNLSHTISRRAWADDRRETAAMIAAARACRLAESKEDLVRILFSGRRITSRTDAELAWQVNSELASVDGPTGSAWGIVNALTRMSQVSRYAADRAGLDAAAGKVLELVR